MSWHTQSPTVSIFQVRKHGGFSSISFPQMQAHAYERKNWSALLFQLIAMLLNSRFFQLTIQEALTHNNAEKVHLCNGVVMVLSVAKQ